MAKFRFTATHGVEFADAPARRPGKDDDPNGTYEVWAKFVRTGDRIDDEGKGHKVYAFETDDAEVAERVRDIEGYGIREDKSKDDDAPKAAKKAAPAAKKAAAAADSGAAAKSGDA